MDIALYAPGLGYYSAGAHKLGRGGDFTTAPEISRLFGACVAQQCADVLRDLGGGSILEIGAGSGRLAADMLTRLEALGRLPARYLILEVSADLRERQRRTCDSGCRISSERVEWLDAPPSASFRRRHPRQRGSRRTAGVALSLAQHALRGVGGRSRAGRFVWAPRPANAAMTAPCAARSRRPAADGRTATSRSTARGSAPGRRRSLARSATAWRCGSITDCRGRSTIFPSGASGTLLCHFRQRAHDDPFLLSGSAGHHGLGGFHRARRGVRARRVSSSPALRRRRISLPGSGIDREMQALAGGDENQFARLANEARRLMLPGEMGERFKAMAWSRGIDAPLRGFEAQGSAAHAVIGRRKMECDLLRAPRSGLEPAAHRGNRPQTPAVKLLRDLGSGAARQCPRRTA